jgi:hypothetical protein
MRWHIDTTKYGKSFGSSAATSQLTQRTQDKCFEIVLGLDRLFAHALLNLPLH